jgi:hypothetical protein
MLKADRWPEQGAMKRYLQTGEQATWIQLGTLVASLVCLLILCQLWFVDRQIDPGQARRIALARVRSSPHLANVDATRVSITFRQDTQAYVVDFAWIGADQVRPGLWTEGYLVVVGATSGDVREAHAYER